MSSGSGAIAGLGVGPAGEPGVSVAAQRKHQRKNQEDPQTPIMGDILRRTKPNAMIDTHLVETAMFAGHVTHIVPSNVYHKAKQAKKERKHWRTYLEDSDHAKVISDWSKKNRKKPIILQDERTGYMCYARYGKR